MTKQKQQGFTIIELLVVIAIMGTLATIFVANYNQQGAVRNLKIAQSQLVTNIRKTQSYILSSRNVVSGSVNAPPRYYMLSMQTDASQYVQQGIDSSTNGVSDIETIKLPQDIVISQISVGPSNGVLANVPSIIVGYSAPFGKMYVYTQNDNCATSFLVATKNAPCLLKLGDRQVVVTLMSRKTSATKIVTLLGVAGTVNSN